VLVLAIDIGSSSARTALFNQRGRVVPGTGARREYSLRYTADGGAELSPRALQRAVRACLRETLRNLHAKRPIVAVAGSAFWHGLLGLDRKARPLTPVFTWADSRSVTDAARLREEFDERKIHAQTGCMLRASFWPAKLRWLRRTNRAVFRKIHRWVSPADWIFEEIFRAAGTSDSMASATGLYDLRTKSWHVELCEACGIDPKRLDIICESPDGISSRRIPAAQIFNPIGDGAASNLGSGADTDGRVALNIGTSAAARILARGRQMAPFGLFRYAVDRRRFVIGGATSNAGNLHQWCLRHLRLRVSEAKALSRSAAADDRLMILPFWVAERAPTWREDLSGAILGLTQSTDAAAILRAAACATFYRVANILELLESKTGRAKEIVVSGGIVRSKESLPLLADALGRDIGVAAEAEASLRGAAVSALEKLGYDPAPLAKPRIIRHDRAFAAKHRIRRARQNALEQELSAFFFEDAFDFTRRTADR
jgi:gluconokinase